jgi:hypothetical protein
MFPVKAQLGGGNNITKRVGALYHADRKRMWDTAILPKMKNEERPDRDKSQLKMLPPPLVSKLMNAKHPKRS